MQSHNTTRTWETVLFLQDVIVYWFAEHLCLGNRTGGEFKIGLEIKQAAVMLEESNL